MLNEADQRRAEVAGMLPCATATDLRNSQKLLKAEAQSYETTSKVEDTLMLKEHLIMKFKHFKRHFKKWEASDSECASEDAKQEFKKLHDDQAGEYDSSDGTEYVKFKNPKAREQEVTGVKTRTGVTQAANISDEQKKRLHETCCVIPRTRTPTSWRRKA